MQAKKTKAELEGIAAVEAYLANVPTAVHKWTLKLLILWGSMHAGRLSC